jgi:hypothetical protein
LDLPPVTGAGYNWSVMSKEGPMETDNNKRQGEPGLLRAICILFGATLAGSRIDPEIARIARDAMSRRSRGSDSPEETPEKTKTGCVACSSQPAPRMR